MSEALTPTDAMIYDVQQLAEQLQGVTKTLARLGTRIAVMAASPEDQWVMLHGEAVTRVKAAKLIGRTPRTIANMIEKKEIGKTPDGNIRIRDLARWANSKEVKKTDPISTKSRKNEKGPHPCHRDASRREKLHA